MCYLNGRKSFIVLCFREGLVSRKVKTTIKVLLRWYSYGKNSFEKIGHVAYL